MMFINLEEIEFKHKFSFCIAHPHQIILIYRTLFVERATFVCLAIKIQSLQSQKRLSFSLFPTKLIVNSTNGFFLTQTVLALTKFENMSLTKSSPSSDSGSFQHFFSVASTTVEGSFIHKNSTFYSFHCQTNFGKYQPMCDYSGGEAAMLAARAKLDCNTRERTS